MVTDTTGKRPPGRHRWEDNIKMDLREVDCDPGNWEILLKIGSNGELI